MGGGGPKWFAFEIIIFQNQIASLQAAWDGSCTWREARCSGHTDPRRRWTPLPEHAYKLQWGRIPSNTPKTTSHLMFTQIIRTTARGNKQKSLSINKPQWMVSLRVNPALMLIRACKHLMESSCQAPWRSPQAQTPVRQGAGQVPRERARPTHRKAETQTSFTSGRSAHTSQYLAKGGFCSPW